MTLNERYLELKSRIQLEENNCLREACYFHPSKENNGNLIVMHFRHIEDYINALDKSQDEFVRTSCSAAMRRLEDLLNEGGWK